MNDSAADKPDPARAPATTAVATTTTDPAQPAAAVATSDQAAQAASRRIGLTSLLTVGLGTTAEVLGNLSKVEHFCLEVIGARAFLTLHTALVVLVGGAIVAGYIAGAWWLLQKLGGQRTGRTLALIAVALLGMVGLAGANYVLLPPAPDLKAFARKEAGEWRDALLKTQRPTGGVPTTALDPQAPTQVWTTAQVLEAALTTREPIAPNEAAKMRGAFNYMEQARIQTPPGGWGYFEDWQTGVTEIAGWVGLAEIASLDPDRPSAIWEPAAVPAMVGRVESIVQMLVASQQNDGGWGPTADSSSPGLSRTYSTTMAVWCLVEARHSEAMRARMGDTYDSAIHNGLVWLTSTYRETPVGGGVGARPLGWVPNPTRHIQNERFLGLTGQVLYVLSRAETLPPFADIRTMQTYVHAKEAFLADPDFGARAIDDNNRLHDNDRYIQKQPGRTPAAAGCVCQPFTIESSTFLWYPWSLAAARALAEQHSLAPEQRTKAARIADRLEARLTEARALVGTGFYYLAAEFIIGGSINNARPPR